MLSQTDLQDTALHPTGASQLVGYKNLFFPLLCNYIFHRTAFLDIIFSKLRYNSCEIIICNIKLKQEIHSVEKDFPNPIDLHLKIDQLLVFFTLLPQ